MKSTLTNTIAALFLTSFLAVTNNNAYAADTLVTSTSGKTGPGLAKSWKKVGPGKLEFQLDPTAKVGASVVTPELVKSAVESILGAAGVKVSAKGTNAVVVTYRGDEKRILAALADTKIKGTDVEIAMDTSGSDTGIRAKTADRAPAADEIKGTVVAIGKDSFDLRVILSGGGGATAQIANGAKVKLALPAGFDSKKGDTIFVKPTAQTSGVWQVSGVSKT